MTKRVPDAHFYEMRAVEKYATSDNPEMLALVARIADWCAIGPGDRVLDFGCFDGYILRKLHQSHGIVGAGVDISTRAVELAQSLDVTGKLSFVVSDGQPLPFRDESFDVAICSEILEHVPDLEATIRELVRVLEDGGRVYLTMPNALDDVFPPLRPVCRLVDRVEGHLRRLTREQLRVLFATHGLEVTRCRYRGFAFSALWYRIFIYSPRVKRQAMGLVTSRRRLVPQIARSVAFACIRGYLTADRAFGWYRGCMGMEAAATKSRRHA